MMNSIFPLYRTGTLCLCLLLLLIACVPAESASGWEVSVLLYSGQANPQRHLSAEEGAQLEVMVAALPAGVVSERGGLGYQGMMVRRVGTVAGDGITGFIVYDGIVEVERGGGKVYFGDPERTLERWLFDATQGLLDDRERQLIQAELDGN